MSANFYNDNAGTIQAVDGIIYNPPNTLLFSNLVSYLLVSATNIVNKGTLIAGANGEMVLTGTNVTLARSGLEITGIQGEGSSSTATNYAPEIAIYDEYWEEGTGLSISGSPSGTTIGKFIFQNGAGEPCGVSNATVQIGPLTPQLEDSYTANENPYSVATTNSMGNPGESVTVYSNIVRQAVFVAVSDPNITAVNHFSDILMQTNYFKTVAVQFNMLSTNVVTQAPQTNTFYLVDDLASSTNRTVLTNILINTAAECSSPTARPSSVVVSRTDPILIFVLPDGLTNPGPAFARGSPGLGVPPANFFYDPTTFTNAVPTGGAFDLYSALIDNLASEITESTEGANLTNLPGRIQIYADNLDLTRTRMDGEGAEITIVAANLTNSAGADISCQNLSFNLGSTNGFLNITNLALQSVSRLHGTVDECSGLWTNYMYDIITNNYAQVINGSTTNYSQSPLTNVVEMDLAITIVDGNGLSSVIPVTVQDLILNSTNIVVSDDMTVAQTFQLNGQSFTLLGGITLSNTLQDWVYTNAPTLLYFTNDGTLIIPNDAHFGDDGPTNYLEFVNNGTISAGSETINSVDFQQNAGGQYISGGFYLTASSGKVAESFISSGQDIRFSANTLQFSNHAELFAGGALDFAVTTNLSDAGASSGNFFTCSNGFNLSIKPVTGDLHGTTLETIAPTFDVVNHTWAGKDLGATVAGFSNNVAIGHLTLVAGGNGSIQQEPEFVFSGTGVSNGLYVDYLDLSQLGNYNFLDGSLVSISPNLTIYFASASTNPAVLNGQFGGHLVWVQAAAAQNFKLSTASYTNGAFQFSIAGQSGQTNIIQASTNLVNWISIGTNVGSVPFTDHSATNYPHRFYRDYLPGL